MGEETTERPADWAERMIAALDAALIGLSERPSKNDTKGEV